MQMFVLGEKLADEVYVDVHGLFMEGQSFTVRAGKINFARRTTELGYPATGTGQIVGDKLIANVIIDGAPFSVIWQSGDTAHSRWVLLEHHTRGLVQKEAA